MYVPIVAHARVSRYPARMKYSPHMMAGLLVFAAACSPDPLGVDVRVDPATADFSVGELTPSGVSLDLSVTNNGTTNAAVLATELSGDAAPRLQLRELPPRQTLSFEAPHPFSLVLVDTQDLDVASTAELAITVAGYGGLGDQTTIRVPITFEGVAIDCDDDSDGYLATSCGGDDCDDTDFTINPGATEACNGIDDDCDGTIDDGIPALDPYFADQDGDGFGSGEAVQACEVPDGYVPLDGDCDDTRTDIYPGAPEDDCEDPVDYNCDGVVGFEDLDGDGFSACQDCDDGNPDVHPGGFEVCDGFDNDCDGLVDPPGTIGEIVWFSDNDGDGFGDPLSLQLGCQLPPDATTDGSDCNDNDATAFPGAPEVCDGADNDCNGISDDDAIDATSWYLDGDGDGFGDPAVELISCIPVIGAVLVDGDCDDGDPAVNPAGTELCDGADNDCDGTIDPPTSVDATPWFVDADGDTFGSIDQITFACTQPTGFAASDTDCDDAAPDTFPGATELCDNADNDCDGQLDEGAAGGPWFADADSDGFGDAAVSTDSCQQPPGFVADATDCDDTAALAFPGGSERCDSLDNDCDGQTDEGWTPDGTRVYLDDDDDGFGRPGSVTRRCNLPVPGRVTNKDDCDDFDAAVNPAADELCDGIDNNCDEVVDGLDAIDGATWFADADGDLFGDAAATTEACSVPAGFTGDSTDCNDADATINPAADELCDGIDNNCNSQVDEDGAASTPWFTDGDGDGFGDPASEVNSCSQPAGTVALGSDCDDTDAATFPGASEICDNADNNCDGQLSGNEVDDDSDGTTECDGDCDDGDAAISPTADELCNGTDDNCDGTVDEDGPLSDTWYADGDGDSFGNDADTLLTCSPPAGYVASGGDCDDSEPLVSPGGSERCDSLDNDCDGLVDDGWTPDGTRVYLDDDDDGFGRPGTVTRRCNLPVPGRVTNKDDCDDVDPDVNPLATEVCNGIDDDCDTVVDPPSSADAPTWFADADGDSWGDAATTTVQCTQPSGFVSDDLDCDDTEILVNPGQFEICGDGMDNDCDGTIDISGIDSDGDGVDNCIDADLYLEDFAGLPDQTEATFDSFGWSTTDFASMGCCGAVALGAPQPPGPPPGNASNWNLESGVLWEASNAAHSIAYSPFHGLIEDFTLSSDISGSNSSSGVNNDAAGLFFGFEDTSNFVMVRWDNPFGSYARYGFLGSVDLLHCVDAVCSTLASTNGGILPSVPGSFESLAVEVRYRDVTVFFNGTPLLAATVPGNGPVGPMSVGAYAFDTDSGVFYDSFTLSTP